MDEPVSVHPGDSWVICFNNVMPGNGHGLEQFVKRWAETEGLRPPLVLYGATVTVIARD
jgi:hypothetical protein